MGVISDFRQFALKGNFLDLAVGVILGAASGKVVSSLVEKVITPPVGLLLARVNFAELKLILQHGTVGPDGKELVKEVAIGYGAAMQAFMELLLTGFVVFLMVRLFQRFRHSAPPPEPSAQEKLLAEIRDLLKAASVREGPQR